MRGVAWVYADALGLQTLKLIERIEFDFNLAQAFRDFRAAGFDLCEAGIELFASSAQRKAKIIIFSPALVSLAGALCFRSGDGAVSNALGGVAATSKLHELSRQILFGRVGHGPCIRAEIVEEGWHFRARLVRIEPI